MSSRGVYMALTASLWEGESVTARVLLETDWDEAPVMSTLPVVWSDSRTCSPERVTVSEIDSLKVMLRMPVLAVYVAALKTGGVLSVTDMGWSAAAAIGLPEVSKIASASMSSWGCPWR